MCVWGGGGAHLSVVSCGGAGVFEWVGFVCLYVFRCVQDMLYRTISAMGNSTTYTHLDVHILY